MNHKDYYQIMGLSSEATDKDVKLAYRRLARKYHPDISKETDAEAHFKEVGETSPSFEALSLSPQMIERIRMAYRLHCELEINGPGIILALELLDEMSEIRNELNILKRMCS